MGFDQFLWGAFGFLIFVRLACAIIIIGIMITASRRNDR
jgi:uncharacterized BrkB/YihY/UPF0761 family membrane protein